MGMTMDEMKGKMSEAKQAAIESKQRYMEALKIYDMQVEALTLQFRALKANPGPVEVRYLYEKDSDFIKGRTLMEEAKFLNDMQNIQNKKEQLRRALKQVEEEIGRNE